MSAATVLPLLLLSAFAAFTVFIVSDYTATSYFAIVLSTGVLAVVSPALPLYYLRYDQQRLVSPISFQGAWVFFYGVVGGWYALSDPSSFLAGEAVAERFFPFVTFLLTLGFMSVVAGYFLIPEGTGTRPPGGQWKEGRIWPVVFILAGANWAMRAYAASLGFTGMKTAVGLGIEYIDNPVLLALLWRGHALDMVAIGICLVAAVRLYPDRPATRWKFQAMALILLLMETSWYAFVQLTRAQIIVPWLAAFSVLCIAGRPPWRKLVLFMVLFFAVLSPFVLAARHIMNDDLRQQVHRMPQDSQYFGKLAFEVFPAALESIWGEYAYNATTAFGHATHWSAADLLIVIAERQEEKGYPPIGSYPLLAPLVDLVPRAVWPDKPLGTEVTEFIREYYGYRADQSDLVLTLPAQLYASFGVAGILIGMLGYGMYLKILYRVLVQRTGATWNSGIVMYAPLSLELFFSQPSLSSSLAPLRDLIVQGLFLTIVLEGRFPLSTSRS